MLLQAMPGSTVEKEATVQKAAGAGPDSIKSAAPNKLDYAPAPGWTVHATKEGRLYYCNHVTRTAGWLPPAEAWKCTEDSSLPYGWERAIDTTGRPYYINHVNKTTTYETPATKSSFDDGSPPPQPRSVTLHRSTSLGFGFVAGSEKPVIVRFVTENGPSVDKLLPGDQILSVNGEDVKVAPRDHVISLVRACAKQVTLVVCQPSERHGIRKSTLLSANKRARLRTKPSRVRFAESVCVNGAPLFPPSAFSLGDLAVAPMANVLKVFLENGQTKSFKYDAWTTVRDVVSSLQTKLCLEATEHFSLVVEHIKSLKRNKLTLLDADDTLARIASRPGAHKLRCLFRVAFVPSSAGELAQRDLNALDYLYTQCCNDVIQERFAPELQYDTALRLAALHIYQHALANNIAAGKLTVKTIEHEFGLERFVPASLLETMKRKEVRKLLAHFLKLHATMAGQKQLTALQTKLHYLDIVAQLPSYGAKCFSAGPKADALERVILVSPKFGLSHVTGTRNSIPVPIATLDSMRSIEVRTDDEVTRTIFIRLQNDKAVSFSMEERDASELVLVLCGYYRLATGHALPTQRDEAPPFEDLAPPYLAQHKVLPEKWSYDFTELNATKLQTVCFATQQPSYQNVNRKTNGLYNTVGRHQSKPLLLGYSLDSNMNSTLSNRNHNNNHRNHSNASFDGVCEEFARMQQLVENSERYLTEQGLNELSEWQETSVDIESDSDEPGQLKHSDSLLLLNKAHLLAGEEKRGFANVAVEMLRQESLLTNQSESDNDSLYTPHNSPKHTTKEQQNRVSFGLRSPDPEQPEEERVAPELIDLTVLPPPATPDELDNNVLLGTSLNPPPDLFADRDDELEQFLASVTIQPPLSKLTPVTELTPEEIMSYIIPPPPKLEQEVEPELLKPVIEYATVDRKGAFSCCGGGKTEKQVPPLPRRRSINDTVPVRPPKSNGEKPPKLPPRDLKKPPLPPVPPPIAKKPENQPKTACIIGSPRLQRNPHTYQDLESCGATVRSEDLLQKSDVAMATLSQRLHQMAGQCDAAQTHGRFLNEDQFQLAKEELTQQSLALVTSSKMLVIAMSDPSLPDLPENLAICLTILRRLTELSQDLTNYTPAPLQTRNLIQKVEEVVTAFRRLITDDFDRSCQKSIEAHLAAQAESLANVLATLLRSLRVFSP